MFEQKTKDELRLCFWPSPQDYNEAVQNLPHNVSDGELSQGLIYVDALGLPRPVTGSFASVYRLKCDARDVALRCFLHSIADQEERYDQISRFVQNDSLPYTVMFDFLRRGVRVTGSWFPALKMEWVEGEPLDRYIAHQLTKPEQLERLAQEFLKMMNDLQEAGIAHGDLQHGNILVLESGELRLVDYDGMYVPGMANMKANELGHRNYQHPKRSTEHFAPTIDNFSAWVIYASIVGLQVDPKLWHQLAAGDDCLLFRQSDFLEPLHSAAFVALEQHNESRLQLLGRFLRGQIENAPDAVPFLQRPTPAVEGLLPLSSASPVRQGPRVLNPALPEWMAEDNIDLLSAKADANSTVTHYVSPPPVAWTNPAAPPQAATGAAYAIEPELLQPVPRNVEYKSSHVIPPPQTFQWLMLLNPFVWGAVCYLWAAVPDYNLMHNGRDYTATVTDSHPYTVNGKHSTYTYENIDYKYTVNGKDYRGHMDNMSAEDPNANVNATFDVHALPNDPTYTEPLFQPAGTRYHEDMETVGLCAFICLIFEFAIWVSALTQKSLVVKGTAVPAEIINKVEHTGAKGAVTYSIRIRFFPANGHAVTSLIGVTADECAKFKVGEVLTVLYDPEMAHTCVIYKLCRYQAVAVAQPAP